MKELMLSGENMDLLRRYLKETHSEIGCSEEKIGDVSIYAFVSVKRGEGYSLRWLYFDVHNMGCFIQFKRITQVDCTIKIWVAGGGLGILNVAGEKGRIDMENKVYEDVKEKAMSLGLKVLSLASKQ